MADFFLSNDFSAVEQWADKMMASLLGLSGLSSRTSTDEELAKLRRTLLRIQALLDDVEEREITDESVKVWLKELKDIAYDSEDLLDEWDFELIQRKMEEDRKTNPGKVSDPTSSSAPRPPLNTSILASRIKMIMNRFDEIDRARHALRLRAADRPLKPESMVHPPTSPYVFDQSDVYGRDNDRRNIIQLVSSSSKFFGRKGNKISVLPIVGMAGLGKTTLAQLVFNDPLVTQHFKPKGWIWVSEIFDLVRLTQDFIESLTEEYCGVTQLSVLQHILVGKLKGKRFFLVLDDVWDVSQMLWERFLAPLSVCAKGSTIIVTTRSEQVATIVQTVPPYRLMCLTESDSWSLFQSYAFDGEDPNSYPDLVDIGRRIVKKCCGMPLATKMLGCHLRSKTDTESWNAVLQSNLWDQDVWRDGISPALMLSYHGLPLHLKRCFAYCSLFPRNYWFKKHQLVWLWMAHGFIKADGSRPLEDIGSNYFDELLRKLFFQHPPIQQQMFTMHGLIHDLARFISGPECSSSWIKEDMVCDISKEARHSSWMISDFRAAVQFPDGIPWSLRTFLFRDRSIHRRHEDLFLEIPNYLFMHLRFLRALDLSNTNIRELPDSIDHLILLRYLGLNGTQIERLPESTCNLYNLQTLELRYCKSLVELPQGTRSLINLRHLDLLTEDAFIGMPPGIGELTDLQTLTTFHVQREGPYATLGELENLSNLRGELHILGLQNMVSLEDAWLAKLGNKPNLKLLELAWSCDDYILQHQGVDFMFQHHQFELLRPPARLEELVIRGYLGDSFPEWMEDGYSFTLNSMTLKNCKGCTLLPPLGQGYLKNLYIEGMDNLIRIGIEFCGIAGFPFLEALQFERMSKWEEWSGEIVDQFPRLRQLTIKDCNKLMRLPSAFRFLTNLEIRNCMALTHLPNLPSLRNLVLENCQWLTPPFSLPSLISLDLAGAFDHVISGFLTLQYLRIFNSQYQSYLFLNNLPSLKKLEIEHCTKLTLIHFECPSSSTTVGLASLFSLEHLEIRECPQLFLFDEQLPPVLKLLDISDCPLLIEWCRRHRSNQLAHVPRVILDWEEVESDSPANP